ncbi:MAG: hypothetical protein GC164_08395 [Phycisphaera sp.]|nr:hypothetical protein [Phycisphaera sp.]
MLGALAVTAAFGVLGALLNQYDAIWRIMWTCFSTAVAAGFMLPLSLMVDREKLRPSGLFGVAAALVIYALVLALIWDVMRLINAGRDEEEVAFSLLCLMLITPFGMLFSGLMKSKSSSLAGLVGLALIAITFVLMMFAVWWSGNWYSNDRFWESAWTVGGYGLLIVMCLAGFNTQRRWWPFAGVAAAVIAAGMLLIHIWFDPGGGPELFTIITSIACVVAHANLVLLCPKKTPITVLQVVTLGSAIATAGLIDLIVVMFADANIDDHVLLRLAAAFAILAACGSLGLIVLALIFRPIKIEAGVIEFVQMTVFCPRCRTKQTVPLGDSQCHVCRLTFNLQVQDPRCPQCDYLLIGLTCDACPECGHRIAAPSA